MISQITGKITQRKSFSIFVDINGICYEVLIPPAVMNLLDKHVDQDNNIKLFTFHYYQTDPSKSIPVLIGFLNEIEKEFFERFITVSGIGPNWHAVQLLRSRAKGAAVRRSCILPIAGL